MTGNPEQNQQNPPNPSPPPLPQPDSADGFALLTDWHYEEKGNRAGPLTSYDIERSIQAGGITRNARFWHPTLTDWVSANDTPFAPLLSGPPPLAAARINSGWAWALAFAPLMGVFLIYFIAGFILENTPNVNIYNYNTHLQQAITDLWWIYIALNALFSVVDANQLAKAGHDAPSGWLGATIVPAYLYSRSNKLGQNQALLIVWVVSFIAAFYV